MVFFVLFALADVAEDTQVDGSQSQQPGPDLSSQSERIISGRDTVPPISPLAANKGDEMSHVQLTSGQSDIARWRIFSNSVEGVMPSSHRKLGEKCDHSYMPEDVSDVAPLKRAAAGEQGNVNVQGEHRGYSFMESGVTH